MIQVFVIAPTLAERTGLRALIESRESTVVVGEAAELITVEQLPQNTDILIISADVLARMDFVQLLSSADPPPSVLLLTEDQAAVRILADVCEGSWGVLNADCTEEELSTTIEGLQHGLVVAEPQFINQIGGAYAENQGDIDAMSETLTDREFDVLQLLADGLANKQIALKLDISEHTVKFHLSSIYAKLNAVNRAEAVSLGVRYGLITM